MPLDRPKLPPEPINNERPKEILGFNRKKDLEKRSFLKKLFFGPDQREKKYGIPRPRDDKKKKPKRGPIGQVLFGPKLKEKKDGEKAGTTPKKAGMPRIFKRSHYRDWLRRSGRASSIFQHRLSRYKLIERGTGLLPPRTGSGYVEAWQIKKKEKDLRKQHYEAKTREEKIEIEKDMKLLKEYKKELETSQDN